MRVAIYYDSLVGKGGAEKAVVQLANALNADIITSGYDPQKLVVVPRVPVHDLGNATMKFSKTLGILYEAPFRFWLKSRNFNYDINIFVGFTSIYGVARKKNSVWYCLTPNRILYDMRKKKLSQQTFTGKVAIYVYIALFSYWDRSCVRKFKKIISQTKTVSKRISVYYGVKSEIIYPPIEVSQYKQGADRGYFLAVSRLFFEKRMDLIAEAFREMPERRLVLVGDGPQRKKIEGIIAGHKNIQLLCDVPEEKLKNLYSHCKATVYMPMDEDYGLVPLEGMASGKPSIAVNEGGCRETVTDGVTGYLISPTKSAIKNAVEKIYKDSIRDASEKCRNSANSFNMQSALRHWENLLETIDV